MKSFAILLLATGAITAAQLEDNYEDEHLAVRYAEEDIDPTADLLPRGIGSIFGKLLGPAEEVVTSLFDDKAGGGAPKGGAPKGMSKGGPPRAPIHRKNKRSEAFLDTPWRAPSPKPGKGYGKEHGREHGKELSKGFGKEIGREPGRRPTFGTPAFREREQIKRSVLDDEDLESLFLRSADFYFDDQYE